MSLLLFGLSAALALLMTNLDNLALMVALLARLPARKVAGAYALALGAVLGLALVVAEGAEAFPRYVGYLGVVPILLGLRELLRRRGETPAAAERASTFVALVLTFLSVSTDSLSVLAPLLADAAPVYRLAGLYGAIAAGGALVLAGLGASGLSARLGAMLERLAPFVMIAVGIYVLLNTATDSV